MGAAERLLNEVMDLNTAAAYLHVHPVTLRDWKRRGLGPPGKKMEGRWRFLRAALDAYLTGTKQPAWPVSQPPINSNLAARRESSGSVTPIQAESAYVLALGLQIEPSQPSGRRSSTQRRSGSAGSVKSPAGDGQKL